MSGIFTTRGITFQHLCAIHAALDLLGDPNGGSIAIEGIEDIVDFERFDSDGKKTYVAQAKTRTEPYTWNEADLIPIIKKWMSLGDDGVCKYEFLSDGQVGPRNKIVAILDSARSSELGSEEKRELERMGLSDVPETFLRRTYIRTRYGEVERLLDSAIIRVLRVSELVRLPSSETAESLVYKMFVKFAIAGGQACAERRVFSRQDIADVVEVPLDVIDRTSPWSEELSSKYRARIEQRGVDPSVIELRANLPGNKASLSDLMGERRIKKLRSDQTVGAKELLFRDGGVAICSPAGGGKTSTLRLLAAESAREGILPMLFEPTVYIPGTLDRSLRELLEDEVEVKLNPTALAMALSSGSTILMVDGLTELPLEERNALRKDLLSLGKRYDNLRLIVSGRQLDGLTPLPLPLFLFEGIDHQLRLQIATRLLDNSVAAERICLDMEQSLGSVVDNPLLFVMALTLLRGYTKPSSRTDLYAGFIDQLAKRHHVEIDFQLLASVISQICFDLVASKRQRAPRYWWLRKAREALDKIKEQKVLAVAEQTGESIINDAESIGILEAPARNGYAGLLHDSFRDYLASEAVARGHCFFPDQLTLDWEETVVFHAEQSGVSDEIRYKAARDNLILAIRLSKLDMSYQSSIEITTLQDLLELILENHVSKSVQKAWNIVNVGILLFNGRKHLYAAFTARSASKMTTDLREFNEMSDTSLMTIATDLNSGPLQLVIEIWRKLLKSALKEEDIKVPAPIPAERAELAKAIESHYRRRSALLEEQAAHLVPSISRRLIDRIGWHGLYARILPPKRLGKEMYHPLVYNEAYGDVKVSLADEKPVTDEGRDVGYTSAEYFLEQDPMREALYALEKAVDELF